MATTPRRPDSLSHLFAFPLLIVPFALYNMIAFLLNLEFSTTMFTVPVLSGPPMPVSTGDVLVLLGIFLLYFEILKATRTWAREIMDHALSLILLLAMTFEFATVQQAASPPFLTLLALSFVDVVGGLTITVRASHRDISIDSPGETV